MDLAGNPLHPNHSASHCERTFHFTFLPVSCSLALEEPLVQGSYKSRSPTIRHRTIGVMRAPLLLRRVVLPNTSSTSDHPEVSRNGHSSLRDRCSPTILERRPNSFLTYILYPYIYVKFNCHPSHPVIYWFIYLYKGPQNYGTRNSPIAR